VVKREPRNHWFWLLLFGFAYVLLLGYNHLFDWDEINFAECAREMLLTGNYLTPMIDFQPFHEKPPFFIWLQATAMYQFGVSAFSARLPNAICGLISIVILYLIGSRHRGKNFGFIWSMLYVASILPHLYFKSGIIDPVFNLFIFLSIYFFLAFEAKQRWPLLLSGLCSSLAVLTKGPVGFLLFGLCIAAFYCFKLKRLRELPGKVLLFLVAFILPIAIWFGTDIAINGWEKTSAFIQYQIELFSQPVAGHQQPFYYHFVVVLLGCFPMSFFAVPVLFQAKKYWKDDLFKWQLLLLAIVLVLFSIVSTKIVHYSSLAYLPLSFLAATYVYEQVKISKYLRWALFVFAALLGFVVALLPVLGMFEDRLANLLEKDVLTAASLQTNVDWSGFEVLIGPLFFLGIVLALLFFSNQQKQKAVITLALNTTVFLLLASLFIVPKIEKYSQGPAISFYQNMVGRDAYVDTHGFKSYADLFYTDQYPYQSNQYRNKDWLLNGKIDKSVYHVTILLCLCLTVACTQPEIIEPVDNSEQTSLKIKISEIKSELGMMRIGVYSNQDSWDLDIGNQASGNEYFVTGISVKDDEMEYQIDDVFPGTYAVSIYHDLNGNDEMDLQAGIIPTEPFGFSNNVNIAFSAPTFSDCSFEVEEGTLQIIEIELKEF